ncbi:16129_t:CDS:2, partial [Dentiscutata heterogama]
AQIINLPQDFFVNNPIDLVDFGNPGIRSIEYQLVMAEYVMNVEDQAILLVLAHIKPEEKKVVGMEDPFDSIFKIQDVNEENAKELEKEHSSDIQMQGIDHEKLSLNKQFEIARVVRLENPFDSIFEIQDVNEENTKELEKEHSSDIQMVNNEVPRDYNITCVNGIKIRIDNLRKVKIKDEMRKKNKIKDLLIIEDLQVWVTIMEMKCFVLNIVVPDFAC